MSTLAQLRSPTVTAAGRRKGSSHESALLSEHRDVTKARGLDERMTQKPKHLEKKRRRLLAEKLQGCHSLGRSTH